MKFDQDFWAVIVGGSSGFGLATAEKLASHGMNLCIVHRDRRSAMSRIRAGFEKLKAHGVHVITFNIDGLSEQGRCRVLDELSESLGNKGRVRLLLHSVAFGSLKLLVSEKPSDMPAKTRKNIARQAGIPENVLDHVVHKLFDEGADVLHTLVDPPEYSEGRFLGREDFIRTIHAMGHNIVEWVQDMLARKLFASDARVISITSEGNSIAWRGYAAVAAAKAVLESVSRAMAVEFAPYGIRSNVIQAGVTDTAALRAIPGNRKIKSMAFLRNPLGRLTTPEDVANVIFLLCTDEAAWINGALIRVDGGEAIA